MISYLAVTRVKGARREKLIVTTRFFRCAVRTRVLILLFPFFFLVDACILSSPRLKRCVRERAQAHSAQKKKIQYIFK